MAESDEHDPRTETLVADAEADTVIDAPRDAVAAGVERLAPGARVGRYVVEEQVGEGGMGVVYAANDPELRRRVALKLLQPHTHSRAATARLQREAQAMAQLAHPNVIRVYDVGSVDDRVFLAIEFIDGQHLGRWLRAEQRRWREVVRVFSAAGRGLAAAHAAGLVHRDFKPDNVLIGKDGRVLVTDFGLARAEGEATDERGALMGTPGYAAPEHLDGTPGDARSDQFSFAASLYAALYGERPYDAKTFAEYKQQLAAGAAEPPDDADVPDWVRRVVERGMALDPGQRFESMTALLDALGDDPAIRRRKWLVAGGIASVVAIAGGVTAYSLAAREDRHALCSGAGKRLDGVWDGPRRAAIEHAFLATDRPYAQTTFAGVAARLESRAQAWVAMRTEACEATRVRGDQPESMMTLRMACLDGRLRELDQLVSVLAAADGKVVDRAIGAVSSLASLDRCADTTALLAAVPPPDDPATRGKVDGLRATLARAKALFAGGKLEDAETAATPVVADAKTLGYRPIEAEALVQLGEIQVFLGRGEAAAATLREAARAAEAGHDDEVRARALAWLVGVVGYDLEKPVEGLAVADDARAALERLGGDRYDQSVLESSLGRTYSRANDYAKMLEHHEKALGLRRELFGDDDPNTANAYNNVAVALTELGRFRDALATHRKAQAIRRRVLGAAHPDSTMSDFNVANRLFVVGELDEAVATEMTALAAARRSLPSTHPTFINGLSNYASALAELGRYAEAQTMYDELFATLRAKSPKSTRMARALSDHAGLVLVPTGHAKEALAQADESIALYRSISDKPDDDMAFALEGKARALATLGKLDDALAAIREAVMFVEQVLGKDSHKLLDLLATTGYIELARGRPSDAAASLERSLAICKRLDVGGKWRARVELALSRALAATDPARANQLGDSARTWFAGARPGADQIDGWLAGTRPLPPSPP